MGCCYGVRKKKKTQIYPQVANKKEIIKSPINQQTLPKGTQMNQQQSMFKKTIYKKQVDEQPKEVVMKKQRDSILVQPSFINKKSNKQKDGQNSAKKVKIKTPKQQQYLQQLAYGQQKIEGFGQNIFESKTYKLNPKSSRLVIQQERGENFALENKQPNITNAKASTKTLQLNFYDKGSILQTPPVSTFRYDTILPHYFGQTELQPHHDDLIFS